MKWSVPLLRERWETVKPFIQVKLMVDQQELMAILIRRISRLPISEEQECQLNELAERVRQGDPEARKQVQAAVYQIVYDYTKRRMNIDYPILFDRGHSVASGVNEAFIRMLQSVTDEDWAQPASLALRVGAMVRYALLDIVRRLRNFDRRCVAVSALDGADDSGVVIEFATPNAPPEPLQAMVSEETCQDINEAVEKLSQPIRDVLNLRHCDTLGEKPLTQKEIAELLGISPTMVHRRLEAALLKLEPLLAE